MFRTLVSRITSSSLLSNVRNVNHLMANTLAESGDRRPIIEKGLNQVILMGRCGTDPMRRGSELRPVVIFSLATHNHYKNRDSDELQQKTDWHRISVFKSRLMDKTMSYAKKGTRLLVQGRLSYGDVTDANGVSHQTTSIVADDIIFVSKSREEVVEEESDDALEN